MDSIFTKRQRIIISICALVFGYFLHKSQISETIFSFDIGLILGILGVIGLGCQAIIEIASKKD